MALCLRKQVLQNWRTKAHPNSSFALKGIRIQYVSTQSVSYIGQSADLHNCCCYWTIVSSQWRNNAWQPFGICIQHRLRAAAEHNETVMFSRRGDRARVCRESVEYEQSDVVTHGCQWCAGVHCRRGKRHVQTVLPGNVSTTYSVL